MIYKSAHNLHNNHVLKYLSQNTDVVGHIAFYPLTEKDWQFATSRQNGFTGTFEEFQEWGDHELYLMGIEETEYLQSLEYKNNKEILPSLLEELLSQQS